MSRRYRHRVRASLSQIEADALLTLAFCQLADPEGSAELLENGYRVNAASRAVDKLTQGLLEARDRDERNAENGDT